MPACEPDQPFASPRPNACRQLRAQGAGRPPADPSPRAPGGWQAAFEMAGRPASDEMIDKSIKALDTDGDGVVDLEEFKAIAWLNATA